MSELACESCGSEMVPVLSEEDTWDRILTDTWLMSPIGSVCKTCKVFTEEKDEG